MAEDKGTVKRTTLSLNDKRDLMWNFTEPGDPYDIRKSMIARLPGEQKFMGPHLELICLLQAAEIERLCQFLEEFKMKFRENERVELDRHSYEVQIRELTQRLTEEQNYRLEIEKLREFIRRQSIELQELQQQRVNNNGELQRNYQQSLRQIAELKQVNVKLAGELRTAREQLQSLDIQKSRQLQLIRDQLDRKNATCLQLQGKLRDFSSRWQTERKQFQQRLQTMGQENRQAQQRSLGLENQNNNLKRQIQRLAIEAGKNVQLSHTIGEYQNRFQILAEEIDRLNGVLRQKSRQVTEQYARSRQLSELIRQKDEEISQHQLKIHQLQQSNTLLQREHRQTLISLSNLQQTKSLTQSYEASLQKLSIEVDRLNSVLRKKMNELEESRRRNNQAEIKLKTLESLEKENGDYKVRYAEMKKRMADYEKEVAQAQQENERLNYSIKKLIEELNSMELKYKNSQKEVDNRQKTIDILSLQIDKERQHRLSLSSELSNAVSNIQSLKLTISRNEQSKRIYETKVGQYMNQIKRLQTNLSQKDQQVSSIRNSKSETELRIRQIQSITQNDQLYIEELINKNQALQMKIQTILEENEKLKAAIQGMKERSPESKPAVSIIDQTQLISQQYQQISRLNDLLSSKEEDIRRLGEQLRKTPTERDPQTTPSIPIEPTSQVQKLQILLQRQNSQINYMRQQCRSIQVTLIEKEEAMQYYTTENQRYYSENQRLKNNLQEREVRIDRLENEIDRINRIIGQQKGEELEMSNESVRLNVQNGVIKERLTLLTEENQKNVAKIHSLQQEMIKIQFQLGQTLRRPSEGSAAKPTQQTSHSQAPSEKKQGLDPSHSGDSLEVDDKEQLHRQLQYLHQRCSYLTQENERYRIASIRRDQEMNSMKSHVTQLQRLLADQRNNKSFKGSGQSESVQMRRKNQQITQYYNKILIFSQEIERLNAILTSKEKERDNLISDYKQKSQNYEKTIRELNINLQQDKSRDTRLSFSSDQRQHLMEQNQRLLAKVSTLQQDRRQYEARVQLDQKRYDKGKFQLLQKEIIRLNKILEVKVEECRVLQQKTRGLARELQQERRNKKSEALKPPNLNQYQSKIALLGQQIERLNGVLRLKVENYQILQGEYHRYQADTSARFGQYQKEYKQAKQESFRLNAQLARLKEGDQYKSLQIQSLGQYQSKIIQLSSEIQRLNRLLYNNKERIDELQEKERKYVPEIERLNNSLRLKVEESIIFEGRERQFQSQTEAYRSQIQAKIRDYEVLSLKYRQLDEENYINKQHLVQYEKRIKVLYEQFQRLQKIITALRKQNQDKNASNYNDLIQKNHFLGGELQRLTKINRRQNQDLSELRLSLVQDNSLQRRINEDLALFVVLFAEIESLRERVKQQEIQIEEVRQQNIAARLV